MKLTIKLILCLLTLTLALVASGYWLNPASAQVISQQVNLSYPIPELGSCRDAKECYFYCEIPANQSNCQQFSSRQSLNKVLGTSTSSSQVLQATTAAGITFPIAQLGNCDSFDACRDYCQEEANREACQTFAQNRGLRFKAIGKITYPIPELGNCADRAACHSYCQEDTNLQACREFATTHGIRVRKLVHFLLQKAQDELGCNTLEECKTLCQNPTNQISCRSFGLKHRQVNRLRQLERLESLPSEATPGALRQTLQNRLQSRPSTPSSTSP